MYLSDNTIKMQASGWFIFFTLAVFSQIRIFDDFFVSHFFDFVDLTYIGRFLQIIIIFCSLYIFSLSFLLHKYFVFFSHISA